MSTIVFQGVQSCVEPQMVETTTLRLKLSSPNNPDSSGWNLIESLAILPAIPRQLEPSYVHPMTKNSYSKLSTRSLELCTENLGCETGTDMLEDAFFSLPTRGEEHDKEREQSRPRACLDYSGKRKTKSFPPPLTTMSGLSSVLVRPIREGGRLVIEAVEAPSSHGCFRAERSNGRLRLSLFKDSESEEDDHENEIEEVENEESFEEIEEDGFEEEFEMGIGNFQRPTRCKECNKGLCNWEPFWVATS